MMKRTLITLDDDDRRWVEQRALATEVSTAEVIRNAIRRARQLELIDSTKGLWRRGDGLRYQRRIRQDWVR